MTCDQGHYKLLCGLAAAGQLSDSEMLDLEEHAVDCLECRERIAQMFAMSRELFLVTAGRKGDNKGPSGMEQRFVDRALRSGIPLSQKAPSSSVSSIFQFGLATCLLIFSIIVGWKFFSAHRTSEIVGTSHIGGPLEKNTQESYSRDLEKFQVMARRDAERLEPSPVLVRSMRKKSPGKLVGQRNHRPKTIVGAQTPVISGHRYAFRAGATESLAPSFNYISSDLPISSEVSLRNVKELSFLDSPAIRNHEVRTFHYSPEVTSLSFLDYPQNLRKATSGRNLSSNLPTFHLDLSKAR